jgi:anti-sigma B factor antagonist
MTKPFNTSIRRQADKTTIDLSGEINVLADQELQSAYTEAESSSPSTIVLNFNEVSYINSTGIALIVGLMARARKNHRTLAVYGLSDHYLEIFQITRLADFIQIYPDEASIRV